MVRNIKTQLKERFGLDHATIEIERGVAPTRHPPKPTLEMSETNNTLISVEDLSVDFRAGDSVTNAVRNVSFDIDKAETVALVGDRPGKTVTALSILRSCPTPPRHPSGASASTAWTS